MLVCLRFFSFFSSFWISFSRPSAFIRATSACNGGIVGSVEDLVARLLIIAGHLHAQVTAAGVDHDVQISLIVPVHLDEVVAAAQGADALFGPDADPHGWAQHSCAQVDLG